MQTMEIQTDNIDLVLIGGGHSHLTVIKHLAMNPVAGLRVTVISKDIHTPYSGMLPGLIAGHYSLDEAHIDLRTLCQSAGIRLFHSEVCKLDLEQQLIHCKNRPAVRYDYLSINSGSQPALHSIAGANTVGIAVKPVKDFLEQWLAVQQQIITDTKTFHLAVVGGGAASVEVALACQFRLHKEIGEDIDSRIKISIYCNDNTLLAGHNRQVQKRFNTILAERGIDIKLNHRVILATQTAENKHLQFVDQSSVLADEIIWAIHAGSPAWTKESQLDCDENGFISVNQYLQSSSHNNVFAAGDVAHFLPQSLAKSGVYAVRAGQNLSRNLRSYMTGKALEPFIPQKRFLSLLMTGDKQAVASKGRFTVAGAWVWRWKDSIDRRFMAKFQQPAEVNPLFSSKANSTENNHLNISAMRCGGCGAKISHTILNKVMAQLSPLQNSDISLGLNKPDDAAVINPPADKQWLQTVDYFRAFIDDPYLLGYIATNHCLSDIYAMGGQPHSALAIATVSYASPALIEDNLLQIMQGAVDSLNKQQTPLIGGHSSEGSEMGFGLSVNGTIDPHRLLTKAGLGINHCLVLSKPLGTGILLAANMHGQAQGRWVQGAIKQMMIDNRQAANILFNHQASACTDITGFGLLGHLLEMLRSSEVSAELYFDNLPHLAGAVECANNGWLSSLQPDNLIAEQYLKNAKQFSQHPHYPLLFDPQTSGGLLAAVPEHQLDACLQALKQADCPEAVVIGKVIHSAPNSIVKLI